MSPPPRTGVQASIAGRHARLADQRVRGGLLSVQDTAALARVGFQPVCEVLGAVANAVTPGGFYSSGSPNSSAQTRAAWKGQGSAPGITYTSSSGNLAVGVPRSMMALNEGYRTMLSRLISEAQAAGADGVVGIDVQRTVAHSNGTQLWQFLAVGTAVRSTGRLHTESPFTTDLSAVEVAASIRRGWLPLRMLIVPCMAIRWIDAYSQQQRRWGAGNVEIDAYTDVIQTCRQQARDDFARAARTARADAAVLSKMTLEFEGSPTAPDCTASVTVTGTALGQFRPPERPAAPLTIMPLRQGKGSTRR